jgi:protein-disulfide isomerase
MEREKTLVYIFVGIFTILILVLGWSFYHQATSFFPAGSRPAIADDLGPKPKLPPIRPEDPVRGSSDENAVTIVEFADFTCVYCRAVEQEIVTVLQRNPEVRHVWRDMPIASDTPEAMVAAVAGRCAKDQGKFWDMHNLLIQANRVTLETVQDFARQISLNQTNFTTCMSSDTHIRAIQSDIQIARTHNLTSAPTLFIGNEAISGFATASEIQWAILRAKWSR